MSGLSLRASRVLVASHIILRGDLTQFIFVQRCRVFFETQGLETIRRIDPGAPPPANGYFCGLFAGPCFSVQRNMQRRGFPGASSHYMREG